MFTQADCLIVRSVLGIVFLVAVSTASAQIADGEQPPASGNGTSARRVVDRPDRERAGSVAVRALVSSGEALFGIEEKSRRMGELFNREFWPMGISVYGKAFLPAAAAKAVEEVEQQVKPAVGVVVGVANPASITVPSNVMYVRFSKSFLRSYFNRQFEKDLPVHDTILGAAVRGTSHTVAHTDLELVENANEAQGKLLFKGTTSFNTTSYSGPIQVHSRGKTQFTSQKRIWFDGLNVLQSKPTTSAKTETNSTNITTSLPRLRGRIALNIAEDEVAAKRGQAQQITSDRTKQRIEQAFEKVAKERAAAFTQALREQYARLPFDGRFALSEILCSTTADGIQIVVIGQGEKEPTFAEAPARVTDHPDIEVHIHSALLQKLVVSAELRKTLQLAVTNMVDRPLMTVVKSTAKPAAVAAQKQPERELKFHWTEGEDLPWLSLAWYEKENSQNQPASKGSARVTRSHDSQRK